jgi:O-antigen ligase
LRWHAGSLLLLTAWCFVTAHASLRPDRSYRYFGYEIGVYAPLYLVLLREGLRRPALRANLSRAALAAVLAAVLLTALFTALYANAGWNLRLALEQYTYTDGARLLLRQAADARTMIWRINFPFGHHNRLAIFSALAVILAALGATQARRLWVRALLALCAVLALSNLGVTLNRGAMVALAAGALAAAGGAAGRRAWPALLLLPLLIFFLPEAQRERLASLARPETYRQADSTVVLRLTHWRAAARMIADNPALGIGYGWKHFQRYYADNLAGELGLPLERVSHAHNVWLQTAAESGLPAAEFWLLWSVTRWCLLAARLRALKGLDRVARARALGWLAAEVLIQVFALGNHPLRRSVGLIVWGVWGVMTADLAAMRPRGQAAGEFQNLQDHGGDNVS